MSSASCAATLRAEHPTQPDGQAGQPGHGHGGEIRQAFSVPEAVRVGLAEHLKGEDKGEVRLRG